MKNIRNFAMALIVMTMAFTGCNNNGCVMMENNENAVIDAIMARRSVRYYTDQPVSREVLMKIAECGVNAPNAMNKQEWEVRIIDDQQYLKEVTELMKEDMPFFVKNDDPKFRNGFRNATAVFAIACPDDPHDMPLINVGLMGENICLAAQDLGLATCVIAGPSVFLSTNPKAKPYLDKLGFSEGYKLRYMIATGYPDESPEAKPRDMSKVQFVE